MKTGYRSEMTPPVLAEHSTYETKGDCTGRPVSVFLSHLTKSDGGTLHVSTTSSTLLRGGLILIDDLSAVEAFDLAKVL